MEPDDLDRALLQKYFQDFAHSVHVVDECKEVMRRQRGWWRTGVLDKEVLLFLGKHGDHPVAVYNRELTRVVELIESLQRTPVTIDDEVHGVLLGLKYWVHGARVTLRELRL